MSDQLDAETSASQHTTLTTEEHQCPAVFGPTITAGERPQTYALVCAAAGTDNDGNKSNNFVEVMME